MEPLLKARVQGIEINVFDGQPVGPAIRAVLPAASSGRAADGPVFLYDDGWFEEQGYMAEAIQHALAAHETDPARRRFLLEQFLAMRFGRHDRPVPAA